MDAIPELVSEHHALRNIGLVQLSPDEGTGVTKVIKKLFTNSVTIQRQIHVYTCTFRSISRLVCLCGKA